jgi:G3E family GTPase
VQAIERNKVPVTVISGYLGSGKTTLLNRILTHQHGKKVAVIVNEFGAVGIDNQLVIDTDEEIFAMNNGCLCCTVRGDLIRIIGHLMKRRHKFERIAIETTGLADPGPVIQSFFLDEDLRSRLSIDAVVTVVDAKHIWQHWDSSELQEQIAFADVILLNKIDLSNEEELSRLENRIRRINALAKIYRTHQSQVEMNALLGVGAFDLKRTLEIAPNFLTEDAHEHDETVSSIALVEPGALDGEKLNNWLAELLQNQGQNIFRMKGIFHLAGEDDRFVFQGVHMLFDGDRDRPWEPEETRKNELVFIGRELNKIQLEEGLKSCLV